jgi:DNA-binding cell septation regulator SpoVG
MTNLLPKITNFRPHISGSLRGRFDCELPFGLRLHECALMVGAKGPWIAMPSRPMVGKDGKALTDANAKRRYEPTASFASREAQDRFSAQVIEALRAAHPEVLP